MPGFPLRGEIDGVEFTQYENNPERFVRLRDALVWAMGFSRGALDPKGIIEMHDHKGELTVTWKTRAAMERGAVFLDIAWTRFVPETPPVHQLVN
jgi:hypothetical protein